MEKKGIQQNKKRIFWIILWVLAWFAIGYMIQSSNLEENTKEIKNTRKDWELTNPALNYEYGVSIMNNSEINLEKPLQSIFKRKNTAMRLPMYQYITETLTMETGLE